MKIPYGTADFADIRRGGNFYVDKTVYLPLLERADLRHVVFLRPRRMGKSSLISMLAHYYDLARADEFDALFSGLWVHEHPTAEKNAHVVLHLNLGSVRGTTEAAVQHGFVIAMREAVKALLPRYFAHGSVFTQLYERVGSLSFPVDILFEMVSAARTIKQRLYVLIDEYDTFANGLISAGSRDVYESVTDHTGFVREFYSALKAAGETGGMSRLFITGVSPMLLDDLYTGFNISTNITTLPQYHALAGFTHADVERGLDELLLSEPELANDERIGRRTELMRTLERYFDGYRFSPEAEERIFNSDMVLYFFAQMQRKRAYPSVMLDPNARTDYKKLYGLFQA
ncbi:MAG TPA: AAA family ATPase, partial [Polyangium sp.]|nr:AAA family ATPase [Polyangium sp.]